MGVAGLMLLAVLAAPPSAEPKSVSLDLKEADIVDVLRYFGDIAGVNLVLDPEVRGKVTLRLIDVPWPTALDMVLRINGLAMEEDGASPGRVPAPRAVLRIAPQTKLISESRSRADLERQRFESAELVTLLIPVSYAKAADVARVLQETVLSPRGRVTIVEARNLLIVTDVADPTVISRARATASLLDR